MRAVYAANVLVAGWVGITTLFRPVASERLVFQGGAVASPGLRVAGALWTAIAVCSLAGLFWPRSFAGVLVIQLVYKGLWLAAVAVPAMLAREDGPRRFPWGMSAFFAVWVVVLPWVIPWAHLIAGAGAIESPSE